MIHRTPSQRLPDVAEGEQAQGSEQDGEGQHGREVPDEPGRHPDADDGDDQAGVAGDEEGGYGLAALPSVTLYSAAASRNTLAFLVINVGVFLPVTIAYHAYANWVFRGRQLLDDGAVPGPPAAPSAVPSPRPAEGGN